MLSCHLADQERRILFEALPPPTNVAVVVIWHPMHDAVEVEPGTWILEAQFVGEYGRIQIRRVGPDTIRYRVSFRGELIGWATRVAVIAISAPLPDYLSCRPRAIVRLSRASASLRTMRASPLASSRRTPKSFPSITIGRSAAGVVEGRTTTVCELY